MKSPAGSRARVSGFRSTSIYIKLTEARVKKKEGMMKEEIGFIHGVPENRDKTWEREVNSATFVFSKTWEPKHKKFYYECHTKGGNGNGFYASSDLDIEELVNEKRFSNIVHMHASGGTVGYA
jgi:hypothetical protein